jgi:hypothetical protein
VADSVNIGWSGVSGFLIRLTIREFSMTSAWRREAGAFYLVL